MGISYCVIMDMFYLIGKIHKPPFKIKKINIIYHKRKFLI